MEIASSGRSSRNLLRFRLNPGPGVQVRECRLWFITGTMRSQRGLTWARSFSFERLSHKFDVAALLEGCGSRRPNLDVDRANLWETGGLRRLEVKLQRFFPVGKSFIFA